MDAGRRRGVSATAVAILVLGIVLTVGFVLAARSAHADNERRLLEQRTRQAAAVLEAAVPAIDIALTDAVAVAGVAPGDWEAVRRTLEPQVGEQRRFISASVWIAGRTEPVVSLGTAPKLSGRPMVGDSRAAAAGSGPHLNVVGLLEGTDPRLGYAVTSPERPGELIVYAEQALPADRRSTVESDSAFAGLDHALYLGREGSSKELIFASTAELPLDGSRAVETVPFGDAELVLVMTAIDDLGGRLLAYLPWAIGVVGALTTRGGAALVEMLHRRRQDADRFAREFERLYGREHEIAHTLQQSLLPARLPDPDGVEIASRYVAGTDDMVVGGDWYDVVEVDGDLVVVVGDVAGRGLRAASVMAAMRYGTHALAARGVAPEDLLAATNDLDTVRGDFVTMCCGVVDVDAGTVTCANAGHPAPLVIDGAGARFLPAPVGPPVGCFTDSRYSSTTVSFEAGSTLLLYTDGLYERRGEHVDVGLERLRQEAESFDGPLEGLLDHLYARLVGENARDDVAMLALRYT